MNTASDLTLRDNYLSSHDMGSMLRAATLRGFAALVDRLGGDGESLLARFRIASAAIGDDDAVVPVTAVSRALETAASTLHCPDFGLRLAQQQDLSVLGPLAVAIENSPTMGEAMACASRFLFVHNPTLTISEESDPEGQPGVTALFYRSTDPNMYLTAQAVDLGLGLFHRTITLLHGGGYGLRAAHLPHPPLVPVTRYTEFFRADVRFNQRQAVLRVPYGLRSTPLHGRDEMLRTLALNYLTSHFPEPNHTRTAEVRRTIARSLGSTAIRIESISRLLRTHPRTLQRQLAAENTTFESVLDEVRRNTAHRLLTQTDLPLSQVAAMIGFSEQSALTRAARRWFGITPTGLRRAG